MIDSTVLVPVKCFSLRLLRSDGTTVSKRVTNPKMAADFYALIRTGDWMSNNCLPVGHVDDPVRAAKYQSRFNRLYRRTLVVFRRAFA